MSARVWRCLYKMRPETYVSHMRNGTQPTSLLHILWDESHIWGLLAVRAAESMALPFRLVLGREIASGLLQRERPSLLLVPGGNARHKAEHLGREGIAAIRRYVEDGGRYLGFCGGAGLALRWHGDLSGLGLCPWSRGGFDDRMQHFMSGHLHVTVPDLREHPEESALLPRQLPPSPQLPVWWPGRFAPKTAEPVTVLAAYAKPASDFWLADLPIADLPPGTFTAWQDVYGLSLSPSFLEGQPCVIHGKLGKGAYVLSYSHLETPDSSEANIWLAHLFRELGNLSPTHELLPAWRLRDTPPLWEDAALAAMEQAFEAIIQTGFMHGMLFARTDWLMGWRTGIPGASLNNIRTALKRIREREPNDAAVACWNACRDSLEPAMDLFSKGCVQYLLAERLAQTLAKFLPETVSPALLKAQREALFGPPMQAGGLYKEIITALDTLSYLQLSGSSHC